MLKNNTKQHIDVDHLAGIGRDRPGSAGIGRDCQCPLAS
jgi:hypothetical protein